MWPLLNVTVPKMSGPKAAPEEVVLPDTKLLEILTVDELFINIPPPNLLKVAELLVIVKLFTLRMFDDVHIAPPEPPPE